MNSAAQNIIPLRENAPLWDFTDFNKLPKTAASMIEHIQMVSSADLDTLSGIALMLIGIKEQKNILNTADFCDTVLRAIYPHTLEFQNELQYWEHRLMEGKQER
nr:hypothetical protein [uncultured bacterium]